LGQAAGSAGIGSGRQRRRSLSVGRTLLSAAFELAMEVAPTLERMGFDDLTSKSKAEDKSVRPHTVPAD
jgi:hypothetical protein